MIATVILSYAFALGVSALLFTESDPALPLFTFIFLVALGVDYNVFLLTRIREARAPGPRGRRDQRPRAHRRRDHERGPDPRRHVLHAAGHRAESLFQVGFTVALGLLVDTFLIRIFLVPSIALLLRSKAL